MRTVEVTIAVNYSGPLLFVAELDIVASAAEGEAWEPTSVKWAELVVYPSENRGQRFMPYEWCRTLAADWLEWLKERDPEHVWLDYGLSGQRRVRFQDACEEAWQELLVEAK